MQPSPPIVTSTSHGRLQPSPSFVTSASYGRLHNDLL